MANYKLLVDRRGADFICSIFTKAQHHYNLKISASTEVDFFDMGKGINAHALLCTNFSIFDINSKLVLTMVVGKDLCCLRLIVTSPLIQVASSMDTSIPSYPSCFANGHI